MNHDALTPAYFTRWGKAFQGDSLELLKTMADDSVDLVMTSPPFALLREKEYGNVSQTDYVEWLASFAALVLKKLKPAGSFVLDLGGAYQPGIPSRSLYQFKVLIHFCEVVGFHLAEEFYWHNPSKLPSPIEWVNKRKIRAKDTVNTVWWFSKTPFPKADVSKVLAPYSDRMKKLLENPEAYYQPKERPSGHQIESTFGKDNGGAIPSNLLQIPNSESNSNYLACCKKMGLKSHPARFPEKLPEFFIKFLTDENDLVLDIFAGSNTTGFVAERMKRRWLAFELDKEYTACSSLRFIPKETPLNLLLKIYYSILAGEPVDLLKSQMTGVEINGKLSRFLEAAIAENHQLLTASKNTAQQAAISVNMERLQTVMELA